MIPKLFATCALVLGFGAATFAADGRNASPGEERIERARASVERFPGHARGWNELAMAWSRRARETADSGCYVKARQAVARSLQIEPDNLGAWKAEAWALLGQHEFAAALELAEKLHRRAPDDLAVYGMLVDAYVELGRYGDAEETAQWLLDLRPGNITGLTRAAYLRELFGDLDGALDLMRDALTRTPVHETEERAWLLTQIAHLQRLDGDPQAASRTAGRALALFPDYHYALAQLAENAADLERREDAVELRRRHVAVAPHPENFFYLARDLARAGRVAEAQSVFERFEELAREEMSGHDNANLELVRFYLDHGDRPQEALRIAELQIARRGDVRTRDAYAWALFRNGRVAEARREIEAVLAVGVRDPRILGHAEAILGSGIDR